MKRSLLLVLGAIAIARPAVAQADAGKAVAALEDAVVAASLKNDVVAVGKLLADDFTFVSPDGKMYDKAGVLAFTKAADNTGATGHQEGYKTRVYGNVVVITGIAVETRKTASGTTTSRAYFTDTWVKSGDTWKWVAGQNTLIR